MTNPSGAEDEDLKKGAVEQDRPGQKTNVSMTGQNPHRDQDPLLKSSDSDYPEPGNNEEHTGEPRAENADSPEGVTQDQDPGFSRKKTRTRAKTIHSPLNVAPTVQ